MKKQINKGKPQETPAERQQKLVEEQKNSETNFYQIMLYTFAHFVIDNRFEKYWPVFTGEKPFSELPIEDKPWRINGQRHEYFNYGFTEESWTAYAQKLRELRDDLKTTTIGTLDLPSNNTTNNTTTSNSNTQNNNNLNNSRRYQNDRNERNERFDRNERNEREEKEERKDKYERRREYDRGRSKSRHRSHSRERFDKSRRYGRSRSRDRERSRERDRNYRRSKSRGRRYERSRSRDRDYRRNNSPKGRNGKKYRR